MKTLTRFIFLLFAVPALSQAPEPAEKRDTIWGLAVVIDTAKVSTLADGEKTPLTTMVWPSYSVSRWLLIVDPVGNERPQVNAVNYYRLEDCIEIPYRRLIAFKQQ